MVILVIGNTSFLCSIIGNFGGEGKEGREVVRMAATGNFALWFTASILGVLLGDYIWSLWERRKRK